MAATEKGKVDPQTMERLKAEKEKEQAKAAAEAEKEKKPAEGQAQEQAAEEKKSAAADVPRSVFVAIGAVGIIGLGLMIYLLTVL